MKVITKTILTLSLLGVLGSCTKLTDIDTPKNQLTTDKVFSDTISAKSALLNIYVTIQNVQDPASNKYLSCYSDETLSLNDVQWNQSRVTPANGLNQANWNALYKVIYQCNIILEQMESSVLPVLFKKVMQNEAKFLRAYAYFYLVGLYGDVPLILSTDVKLNRRASRTPQRDVYTQIITDLTDAGTALSQTYQGTGKIRANKYCATALLARIYLYLKNWTEAERLASEIIESGNYTPLESPANTFKKDSRESILELSTPQGFVTAMEDVIPSLPDSPTSFFFSEEFMNSFENGDLRKYNWIGTNVVPADLGSISYRYPSKYKNYTANSASPENLIVLRAAEQYLIRAEARTYLGKLIGAGSATEDLNIIRSRASLPKIYPVHHEEILKAIYTERRHEMFFENADRFLDLKRTGRLQQVMTATKSSWRTESSALPIPISEISYNSNLKQNEGY